MDCLNKIEEKLQFACYVYETSIEVTDCVGVNVKTSSKYTFDKIKDKFGSYFKIKKGIDTKYEYYVFSSTNVELSEDMEAINCFFEENGEDFTIHLGHNENENRYGKKVVRNNKMYVLFLYSKTLLYVDYLTKRVYISNNDESKTALDTTRVIKDGILQRLLEKTGWLILHAGFVKYKNKGFLLLGKTGAGKTTLLLGMCGLGGTLISNDRVFYNQSTGEILGWPEDISIGVGCINANEKLRKYFGLIDDEYLPTESHKKKLLLKDFKKCFGKMPESKYKTVDYIIVPCIELKGQKEGWENISSFELNLLLRKSCLSPHDPEHPHWLELIQLDDENRFDVEVLAQKNLTSARILHFKVVNDKILEDDKETKVL